MRDQDTAVRWGRVPDFSRTARARRTDAFESSPIRLRVAAVSLIVVARRVSPSRPSTPTRVALCVARRCATATGDAAGKLQNSSVYGPVRSLSRSNARDISRAFGGKIARPSDERPTDQEGDLPLGIAWDPSRESDGAEVPRSRPAHGLKNCSNTGNNRINRLLFKGNRPDLSASR